jgi:outer membrane protein assembly factor BamB
LVYVGSNDRYLYALDATTGTERWKFTAGDRMYSTPAVSGGVVYVGSDDDYLYALDATTGTERWKFKTSNHVLSSPAVSGGVG